jgi:hypothetical protein
MPDPIIVSGQPQSLKAAVAQGANPADLGESSSIDDSTGPAGLLFTPLGNVVPLGDPLRFDRA